MKGSRILIGLVISLLLVGVASATAFGPWQAANGCYTATNGTYNMTMWNATGSFTYTIPSTASTVTVLDQAGGAGGSGEVSNGAGGSGGGAGGLIFTIISVTPGNVVNIHVGKGGTGGTAARPSVGITNGENSSFANTTMGDGVNAMGGGKGTYYGGTPGNGGSGGGGAPGAAGAGGTGVVGQGYGGGVDTGSTYNGPGGGGYSSVGGNTGSPKTGGNGGTGANISLGDKYFNISGGGGGGFQSTGGIWGVGSYGGGDGGHNAGGAGSSATPNTGGGGGGGSSGAGGDGASGLVVILYSAPSASPSPISAFTPNGTQIGVGSLSVTFTDISNGTISDYNWTYQGISGGNNTLTVFSTAQNVTASFYYGNYSIKHGVNGTYGSNLSTQIAWVNVSALAPVASFSINTTGGIAPLNVGTTDTSTNTPTSWAWGAKNLTPGNNTWFSVGTSQNQAFVLGYGNWSVNLTASNTGGSNTSTQTTWVNVTPYVVPSQISANFTATPLNPTVYASVSFTDTSTGGPPTAWHWDFGDGSISTLQNPLYAYTTVGLKTVTLTSSLLANASNNNTVVKTNYINVTSSPPPAPVANFNGTPTTQTVGAPVQFVDMSVNTPTSWSWDFGDTGGSSLQNPAHVYASIGNYTVALTATNAQGSNTMTKINYTTIVALSPPVASFTTNVSSGQNPLAVQFTDTSSNMPTTWLWNFSDGGTSSLQNPAHLFTGVGNYTVSLSAYNGAGNSTKIGYINVVSLSGFNQQDIWMAGAYTFKLLFTDSNTGAVIPVATVLDSNGGTQTTTNGTYIATFPYSVVAITASATGYAARQVSYIIDSDQSQTMQLTPVTVTTNSNTVWYVPKTVEFHVVDAYGNYVVGANVTGRFNSSTTLPGGLSNLLSFYGMNQNAANDAANGTLIMTGGSDSMGNIVFTMLSTLNYDVYVTYNGVTNHFTIHPQSTNYELRFLGAAVSDYSLQTCLYANGHTYTLASSDYLGNFTMGFSYQDTCSKTTALDYYVILQNTGAQVYTYHQAPVTNGIYTLNYTVPNVRGNTYKWFENYTRSV